jgi:hypothetical protein
MTDPVILAAAAYLLMPQLAPTMIHTYPAFDAEQAQAAYASLDHRISHTGVISPRPHCVGFWCYVFKASYRQTDLAEATDMESANPHNLAATQPAAPAPDLRRHHHRRHHHGHHRRGR